MTETEQLKELPCIKCHELTPLEEIGRSRACARCIGKAIIAGGRKGGSKKKRKDVQNEN